MSIKMASNKLTFYSLCSLIILILDHVANTQGETGQQDAVFIDRIVEPFDWRVWVGKQKFEKHFPHVGPIKDIGNLMSKPHFFSASFNIYTRQGNSTGIKLEPTHHCTFLRRNGADYRLCNDFEFNLAKLAPEFNVFDPKKRTIITIPGFRSTESDHWPQAVRDKWLELEDVNVINVNWPEGCSGTYYTAVSNSRIAARQVTMLLYYLAQMRYIDFGSLEFRRSIQIVGHSLGAHLAGAVGEELRGQVGRIVGLDPAGPSFESFNPDERLDSSDALLVDVIHTNAGSMDKLKSAYALVLRTAEGLILGSPKSTPLERKDMWWGINFNCGHLDYWVNGGSEQPGCSDPIHNCDHMRATDLYINALDYESHARRAFGPNNPLIQQGKHRLRAFPAADFDEFKSGESFPSDCPSLHESVEYQRVHKGCAIPMDFVSDVEEYRSELSKQYSIQLGTDADSKRRLYFETQATEPFLSAQHLLRVHLKPADKSCGQCDLRVTAHSRANPSELYSVVAQDLDVKPLQYNGFYGLEIPFANPNNWRAAFPTPERVGEHLTHYEESSDQDFSMKLLVPESVELGLDCQRPNKFKKAFGAKSGESCRLEIEALEMKPLASVVDNVSSWYLSESENGQGKVPLKRQVEMAAEPRDTIVELSPKGRTSANLYLTSLSVGRE